MSACKIMAFKINLNVLLREELKIIKSQMLFNAIYMFVSKLIAFKRNLNVLFRERLKIHKAPNMKITFTFSILHHQKCSL